MTYSLQILCAVVLTMNAAYPGESAPVISAPWGQISGKDSTGPGGRTYSAYLAIPYALPPVGERRFAKPVAHPGLGAGQVFNGSSLGYQCPQAMTPSLDEDCLTLNVYVPASGSPTGLKNVMVWIHGGGFIIGGAWGYKPSELVTENDVIVVVIQYRLGILGFLSSGDDVIPGNYGLMDQTLALRWVKDNIRAFGGNPDTITIFGESAGAMSVGLHMLTPYSRGLFSRAILQSGSPLSYYALKKDSLQQKGFYYVANKTGCLRPRASWYDRAYSMLSGGSWQQADHQSILQCLKRLDWKTLLPLTNPPLSEFGYDSLVFFGPTVDGDYIPRDPMLLVGDPEYLASVGATSIDVMSGMTNEEGSLEALAAYLSVLAGDDAKEQKAVTDTFVNLRNLARILIQTGLKFYFEELEQDARRMELLTDVIEFFYLQPLLKGEAPREMDVANIATDIFFLAPAVAFTRDLATARQKYSGRLPVGRSYLYLFNHYPARKVNQEVYRGTAHAEDLSYEFDATPLTSRDAFNSDDYALGTTFRSMLTNFAKTGDPQLVVDRQSGETWPQYTLQGEEYLSLEVTPRVADRLYAKRAALLMDLVPSLVNSTRVEVNNPWMMPRQPGGQVPFGPTNLYFNGRVKFFKLN